MGVAGGNKRDEGEGRSRGAADRSTKRVGRARRNQIAAAASAKVTGVAPSGPANLSFPWPWLLATLAIYTAALALLRNSVPGGLSNDVAEEALRGLRLIEERRFEVITVAIGNSAETLYLYALGAVAKLVGTTTLAVQLPAWGLALAVVTLILLLARRLEPGLPAWVPLLLAASSVWLYHYARTGPRAISAPVFFLAFALLLDAVERDPGRRGFAIACGAVLGLSLYAYTACRILPLALAVHATLRFFTKREGLRRCAAAYATMIAAAIVVSIPNLVFLARSPRDFLFRGSYVAPEGLADSIRHLLWSVALPLHYPASYGYVRRGGHYFDGVSAGLTSAGVSPVHLIVGIAFVLGLAAAWRRRGESAVSFLLAAWITGTLVLGFTGPSLTRLLILLPAYLAIAALGAASLIRWRGSLRPAVAAAFVLVIAWHGYAYFQTFRLNPRSQEYFSPAQTPIGLRARALAREGRRTLCVVSANANVVRYLTHDVSGPVRIVEFYQRAADPAELRLAELDPDVLLIENEPSLRPLSRTFPQERLSSAAPSASGAHPRFEEVRIRSIDSPAASP
jgi:hypothetical protein